MVTASPSPAAPETAPRRSFHYRQLVAAGARFRRLGDAMVAADFGGMAEAEAVRKLGLADLSPLTRIGFKGAGMADWLAARGAPLGSESNRAYPVTDGILAARLAPGEVLLLGRLDGNGEAIAAFEHSRSYELSGVWPVPRRDASFWFMATGEYSPAIFAKVCGVDLRPRLFRNHQIAQTSVARTNCIVVRDDLGGVPAYHLLGDSASAGFMWSSVLDAMQEFDGRPVGLDALLTLTASAASLPNV